MNELGFSKFNSKVVAFKKKHCETIGSFATALNISFKETRIAIRDSLPLAVATEKE